MNNGHDHEAKRHIKESLDQEAEEDERLLGALLNDRGEVHFEHCPVCKSTRRLFETFYGYLLRHSKVPAGLNAYSSTSNQFFANPAAQLIGGKVPGITVLRDVCLDCGIEYVVRLVRIDGVLQAGPPQQRKG